MKQILRYTKFAFVGLIIGYIINLLLGNWVWLDMRVNISLIIPIAVILTLIFSWWNKCLKSKLWLVIPEIIVAIEFLSIYWGKLDAIKVIPGILFKEAFSLSFISLQTANISLLVVMILGNLAWLINIPCVNTQANKINNLVYWK